MFTSSGNHQQEVQYDTYPRRKKKKEKQQQQQKSESGEIAASSPLTVIDGNYSFSLSDDKDQIAKQQREQKDGKRVEVTEGQTFQEKEQLAKQSEEIRAKQIRAKTNPAVKSHAGSDSSRKSSTGQIHLPPQAGDKVGQIRGT